MKRTDWRLFAAALGIGVCAASADIIPGNDMFNSDVETASDDPAFPLDWFHSATMADWSTDQSVSPAHSLHINDTSTDVGADWRSHGVLIPAGNELLTLHWHWLYTNVDGEFAVTIRFFDGVDDIGNTTGSFHGETNYFTGQGSTAGWEARSEFVFIPPDAGSYDVVIRTLSGAGVGGTGATGEIFADDISAAFFCTADWNLDSVLDSQDFFDFLESFFSGNADFNGDFITDSQDYFDFLEAFFAGC